jgi:hypothetical protein
MDLEVEWEGVDWIVVAQDRNEWCDWCDVGNAEMNFVLP